MSRPSSRQRLQLDDYREVSGQYYGTPKEVWGFSMPARKGTPRQIAEAALRANSVMLKLDPQLRDLDLRKVKKTASGSHVIFSQSYFGIPIHRAYVTVHMDRNNRVYMIKNRAVPEELLPPVEPVRITETAARRLAVESVKGRVRVLKSEMMWFPRKDRLRFAYKIRVQRRTPAAEWIIFVDAITGSILSKYDTCRRRAAQPACSIQALSSRLATGGRS